MENPFRFGVVVEKDCFTKILIELSTKEVLPLQEITAALPTSTVYSGLKRLSVKGYIVNNDKYVLDDPFFKKWIIEKRKNNF